MLYLIKDVKQRQEYVTTVMIIYAKLHCGYNAIFRDHCISGKGLL